MKAFLLSLTLLTACIGGAGVSFGATADFTEFHDPFESAPAPTVSDPWESLNRASFWLNDQIYTHILAPVCRTLPDEVRGWAGGLFAPLSVGGAELKFKFRDAGSEAGRFMLHGMVSLLSRLEPDKTAELAGGQDDFGATLQAFGIGPGYYLVLPILGPSSVRDGLGRLTAFYLDPTPSLFSADGSQQPHPTEESLLEDLETYLAIRRDSLDPYLFIRDAFAQQQKKELVVSRASGGEARGRAG